jgi:hypothetical protein
VQAHVLRQAAVVRKEVLVVPLVALARRLFAVVPAVVRADGHDIVAIDKRARDLDAERIDAVLVQRDLAAVDEHRGRLARAFEFEEHLLPRLQAGHPEVLAIPGHARRQVRDVLAERVVLVPCVRQADGLPRAVVEAGTCGVRGVADDELPAGIEVIQGARGVRGDGGGERQQQGGT